MKRVKQTSITFTKYRNFNKNTTIFNSTEFPDPEVNTQKYKISKEIKEIGDKLLEMNIYDSLLLGEYMKVKKK